MSANSLAGLSDEVGPLKPAEDMAADQVLALRWALRQTTDADARATLLDQLGIRPGGAA